MRWKAIGRVLLFPPIGLLVLLIPVAAGYLVYTMAVWMIVQGTNKLKRLDAARSE